ncbi:MAG: tetratricopeptide repeat protein [Bacteroidota bacterium]
MSRFVWAGFLLLAAFGLIVTSCQQKSGKKADLTEPRETIVGRIDRLEKVLLHEDVALNDAAAAQIVKDYLRYQERWPDDPKCPDYLFKAADVMRGMYRVQDACTALDLLVRRYPKSPQAPEALFFAGFMLHNDISEQEKANEFLQRVIEEYPLHPRAVEARQMIQVMGMDEQDLLRYLEEQGSKDGAS